jgi:hypothetical protein
MPVILPAGAVVHGEGTEQPPLFIPLAAGAVQPPVPIAQFLGQLAVMVPGAVKTVELAPHLPDLRVGAVVTIIKPFYAKFWHFRKSTVVVSVTAFLTSVLTGVLSESSQKCAARKPHFCANKTSTNVFPNGDAPISVKRHVQKDGHHLL